jgi:ATP-dependent exoDNAse (exonuclease V) beta subunit
VEFERTSASGSERPRGPRFGTLVHALLAELPLDTDTRACEDLAHAHGRLLGATEDEVQAAQVAALAAFAHPLMRRARAADALRRETPMLLRTPDGSLIEGIVDLAFREGERWTVVDFKTDLSDAPLAALPRAGAPLRRRHHARHGPARSGASLRRVTPASSRPRNPSHDHLQARRSAARPQPRLRATARA